MDVAINQLHLWRFGDPLFVAIKMDEDFDELHEENEQDAVDEEMELFENENSTQKDCWKNKGRLRDEVIRDLIKCFASMVQSSPIEYAICDNRGRFRQEDLKFTKLLDASKYIIRAKRYKT